MSPSGPVGRDRQYLREVQYKDPVKLTARANLHARYRTAPVTWFEWVGTQVDWPSGADVLEVGCGPGWLWAEVGATVPDDLRLTLTDLSPGMVAVAGDRIRALVRFEVVEARVADAEDLPFADGDFAVVVANQMLYHVPDPPKAVAEIARVLDHHGVLVAGTSGHRHLSQLWEIRSEVFGGPASSENTEAFGAETGAAIVGRSFESVEWRPYADTLRCTSPDDVVAFLTSGPPGEDASPGELDELRRVVASRFDAGDGVFEVSKDMGILLARRPRRRDPHRT